MKFAETGRCRQLANPAASPSCSSAFWSSRDGILGLFAKPAKFDGGARGCRCPYA